MELELCNLRHCYGKTIALDGISCCLTPGIYGVLGPNGAGKTTLIQLLTSVQKPTSGNILLDGNNIEELGPSYLDFIGYSPQSPVFYPNFQVDEFMQYICALKGISNREASQRITDVLHLVHLENERRKRIASLSGGMKQRLSIAQAILNNPQIIVLDEPTAGLDPGERIRFRNIISKISPQKIIIMTTHIVSDVSCIADKIIILKQGKMICCDAPEILIQKMEGKVWIVATSLEASNLLAQRFLVSNLKQVGNTVEMRILSETSPCDAAIQAPPQLEDAFLFAFGKVE